MIHFDFYVSEEDAENIFAAITSEIQRCLDQKLEDYPSASECLDSEIEYWKELKKKMTNKKVT